MDKMFTINYYTRLSLSVTLDIDAEYVLGNRKFKEFKSVFSLNIKPISS